MTGYSSQPEVVRLILDACALLFMLLLSILSFYVKKLVDKHLNVQEATLFNTIMDGLTQLADATVQNLNQKMVSAAKANGTFTPDTAQLVKQTAVKTVLTQGKTLISLAENRIPEIESLVEALIEQAVVANKKPLPHAV